LSLPKNNVRISQITSDISGWLTIHEGQFLYKAAKYVKNKTGVIVEIGSYCGKSTIWLAANGEHVYAIDPHKGKVSGGSMRPTYKTFLKNIRKADLRHYVHPIVKTSLSASRRWTKPITLLFIDGLHDEIHAREDFALWNRYLINGGIIAMHDAFCGWEGAGDVALRKIVNNPAFGEIGVVGSIMYGIKGEANGIFRIKRLCNKLTIELCSNIYRSSWIPKRIQFVLVHKFLRIFLINRFTSF
jgi:predicted O-methyltransferase YrrM